MKYLSVGVFFNVLLSDLLLDLIALFCYFVLSNFGSSPVASLTTSIMKSDNCQTHKFCQMRSQISNNYLFVNFLDSSCPHVSYFSRSLHILKIAWAVFLTIFVNGRLNCKL